MLTINPSEWVRRLTCTVTSTTGEKLHEAQDALELWLEGLPFEAGTWMFAFNNGKFDDPGFAKWHGVLEEAKMIVHEHVPDGAKPLIKISRPPGRPRQPPVEISETEKKERRREAIARAKASREARVKAGQVQTNIYLKQTTKAKAGRIAKARGLSGLSELFESLIAGIDEKKSGGA